jgi:hypothetical protein
MAVVSASGSLVPDSVMYGISCAEEFEPVLRSTEAAGAGVAAGSANRATSIGSNIPGRGAETANGPNPSMMPMCTAADRPRAIHEAYGRFCR